jgi:translation initiation factor IF-3
MRRKKYRRYKQPVKPDKVFKNQEILFAEMRVIDHSGKQLGIMKKDEAITEAKKNQADLILITTKTNPPICKIIEYNKYLFQQKKKKNKKIKETDVKGIRLSFAISDHDMETKAQRTKHFLQDNNKVKIEILLKGRELAFQNVATEKINKFIEKIKQIIEIKTETNLKKEHKGYSIIISKR